MRRWGIGVAVVVGACAVGGCALLPPQSVSDTKTLDQSITAVKLAGRSGNVHVTGQAGLTKTTVERTIRYRNGSPGQDTYHVEGGTLETLGALKPAFKDDGVVTAGNASQISDGAAALLITTTERAAELGLRPLARVHTAVVEGSDPMIMLTGPIPATAKALKRSGLSLEDIGVFEVNEAFATVPLAWLHETGADIAKLNPNCGAIALGHPLGGSGARIMTTLVHQMRAHGIRYGLQTMCEGGGQANATILELV